MDGGQDRVLGVLPNGPLHCMCETLHLTQPLGKKTGMCACGEGDSVKGQICWQSDSFSLRRENIDKMLKTTTAIKRHRKLFKVGLCHLWCKMYIDPSATRWQSMKTVNKL